MDQAKGELVPGGLAMVIGCMVDQSNIGMIVVTESQVEHGSTYDGYMYNGPSGAWLCTADGLYVLRGGEPVRAGYAYIDAEHLMPINPEADPLETTQERDLCLTQ